MMLQLNDQYQKNALPTFEHNKSHEVLLHLTQPILLWAALSIF